MAHDKALYKSTVYLLYFICSCRFDDTFVFVPRPRDTRGTEQKLKPETKLRSKFEGHIHYHAKCDFYRAANAIFGRVGRISSEEVVLKLAKCKCLPVLLYCLNVCPLTKPDLKSLDFVINRFFYEIMQNY